MEALDGRCGDVFQSVGIKTTMRTPYPYFGNKREIAPMIWERVGDPHRLIIPFAGSMSELLARPRRRGNAREIVNDKNGFITNFWRAIKSDSSLLVPYLMEPINEINLHAWNRYLIEKAADLSMCLRENPRYFCAETAGVWAWGQCLWIGEGWTTSNTRTRPQVSNNQGLGSFRRDRKHLLAWLMHLEARISDVDILCGDWTRCVGSGALSLARSSSVGIILDPPYTKSMRRECYAVDEDVAADVRQWCISHGEDTRLRIALCGLRGEHDVLEGMGWSALDWHTGGGMSRQYEGDTRGKRNATERIWFSPGCLEPGGQMSLL